MSAIAKTQSLHGFRVSEFLRGVATSIAQYRLYRKTLVELDKLSERELADLGLTRPALRSVAYKSVYTG